MEGSSPGPGRRCFQPETHTNDIRAACVCTCVHTQAYPVSKVRSHGRGVPGVLANWPFVTHRRRRPLLHLQRFAGRNGESNGICPSLYQRQRGPDSRPFSWNQRLEPPLVLLGVKHQSVHDLVLLLRRDEVLYDQVPAGAPHTHTHSHAGGCVTPEAAPRPLT